MSDLGKSESVRPGARKKRIGWSHNEHPSSIGEVFRQNHVDYIRVYKCAPFERIQLVKEGVLASVLKEIVADLDIPAAQTYRALDVPVSTINRKAKTKSLLSQDEGERVVGLAKLVGQVEAMVEDSDPEQPFDVFAWTARWLREPLPALGGARPLDFMDTMEGQTLVSDTLARVQSGAYG